MQCEAVLLGREAVEGAVDAVAMATLIRALLQSRERIARSAGDLYRDRRRYLLRCREGLEIVPSPKPASASASASPSPTASSSASSTASSSTRPRRADDEGFESDDDTASTKSAASLDDTVSNSSSCCFVDDHVFKFGPGAVAARSAAASTSSNSSVATDSANSSGASDTDDVDSSGVPSPSTGSVSKLVKSLTLYQRGGPAPGAPVARPGSEVTPSRPEGEVYPVADIAFCHLDPAFPKVVVWVVKRKRPQRLTAIPDGGVTGLQAIVFECANERALKKFCANFQEMSRRAKLDQYKHPHRRKDLAPAFATLYRGYLPAVSREKPSTEAHENTKCIKLELEISKAAAYDSKTLSHQAVRVQKIAPKTLPKPAAVPVAVKEEELPVVAKFNLVQRTDGDGVTHIEVARGSADAAAPTAPRVETLPETSNGPSSIISISTPDVGNLLTTGPAPGTARGSRLGKEIEGVIRSDVDAASRREPPRQRQPAILVMNPDDAASELHKVWNPPEVAPAAEEEDEDQKDVVTADPPQRPERRKYIRKKNPAPQPPVQQAQPPRSAPSPDPYQKKPLVPYKPDSLSRGQKIVRGQFIRVSVEQPVAPVQQPWIFGSSYAGGWGGPETPREHLPRRGLDDMFAVQGHSLRQHPHKALQHRRSRSTGGAGRSRSKSPPLTRRPMAYRYIDVANPPPPPPQPQPAGRFFGLSQKLKELGGGSPQHPSYATTARRRGSAGEATAIAQGCHLKSVIKKSKRAGEYVEPKKVTFSAYATVQVVD